MAIQLWHDGELKEVEKSVLVNNIDVKGSISLEDGAILEVTIGVKEVFKLMDKDELIGEDIYIINCGLQWKRKKEVKT